MMDKRCKHCSVVSYHSCTCHRLIVHDKAWFPCKQHVGSRDSFMCGPVNLVKIPQLKRS